MVALSQLEIAESAESAVLRKAKTTLKDELELVDEVAQLYACIQQQYVHHGNNSVMTPEQSVLFQAVISCKRQFVLGILTLLRGHLGDACGYLRKAQEYTIFAARVLEEANTAIKWLQAGDSDEAWEDYKKEFKIYYMTDPKTREKSWKNLASDLDRLEPIFEEYDSMSRRLHATVLAAGPFKKTNNGEAGLEFHDGPVDLSVIEDLSYVVDLFFYMLECHLDLIHVHARVLLKRSELPFNESAWTAVFERIENKVDDAKPKQTTESAK